MNTNEIHDRIQLASTEPTQKSLLEILNILDAMNENIARVERAASHANNVAGCLANGIIPD